MKLLQILSLVFFFSINHNGDPVAQDIQLINPDLEAVPKMGGNIKSRKLMIGWIDCGVQSFPEETAPDIHPNNFWDNKKKPANGHTYVGLVVRSNDTWESISQKLVSPMLAGQCYEFSIKISRSDNYWSGTKHLDGSQSSTKQNYTKPSVLRIWGGRQICGERQLLAESSPISNGEWKEYNFKFRPKTDLSYIKFEAFYKTPNFFGYNGHILIDDLSDLKAIDCDKIIEDIIEPPAELAEVNTTKPPKTKSQAEITEPEKIEIVQKAEVKEEYKEPKILWELRDPSKIKSGQVIRLKNLYFEADTSSIPNSSEPVLDELAQYLRFNHDVIIEVGGHTNGQPPSVFCDSLSTVRAKTVADFLVVQGVNPEQIKYKGYGKRKPIASNNTAPGRRRNQRVEIKILAK